MHVQCVHVHIILVLRIRTPQDNTQQSQCTCIDISVELCINCTSTLDLEPLRLHMESLKMVF